MKSVILARVSSREQEETGYSLPSQEKLIGEYASRKTFEVAKIFSVAESASGAKQRKTFQEMMDFMRRNKIPVLLCEKVDRLTRNFKDSVMINDWLEEDASRSVHFVKQNLVLSKDSKSDDKFRWDMEVVLAKKYIANLSEEVKKGQKEKAEQGWFPTKPPLGYKTIGEAGHKTHVFDEERAPHLKKMFELYSTGLYSLSALIEVMGKRGLRTRNNKKLAKSRMADILADPFYIGKFIWKEVIHQGKHEPLVSKQVFDQVQKVLCGKTTPAKTKHLHLFRGLVRCANCDGLVTWEKKKGIVYGHCNYYKGCPRRAWCKEVEFVKEVTRVFSGLEINDKKLAELVDSGLRNAYERSTEHRDASVKSLQSRLTKLNTRLDQLYEDKLSELITREQYEQKRNTTLQERDEALGEVKALTASADEYRELSISIFELSQKAGSLFLYASDEDKRRLMNLAFEKINVKDGNLEVTFNQAFKVLYGLAEQVNSSKANKNSVGAEKTLEPVNNGSTKRKSRQFVPARSIGLRG